jgi:hypothetical protein
MVKVILRSLVFRNPTQVQLIRGDPRYKLMSPEEVIGKFVGFELMIKGSKQIVYLEQGSTSRPEVQPVAFKAMEEKKEESTSSRLPIDASKLDNKEMALIIKSFRHILKQRRGKDYKPCSKRVCYKCGKPGHFIAKCLCLVSAFRTRGSLDRRVNCRRVPQPRWVGTRRSAKGGRSRRKTGVKGETRGLRVCPAPRSGALAVGGYKRPRGRERAAYASAVSSFPARPTLCKRALDLPFIGVRRGSRCTMGGVAVC